MNNNSSLVMRVGSLLAILMVSVFVLFSVIAREVRKETNLPPGTSREVATAESATRSTPRKITKEALRDSPPLEEISPAPSFPPEPSIEAQSFLVQFIGDATPLLKRREARMMKPASVTKLLTALMGFEELSQQEMIPISLDAKTTGEKISEAAAGATFIRGDIIRLALISSANDAATAIAEAIGRKQGATSFKEALDNFMVFANQKAKDIGLVHSQFANPTGLDDDNHYTTAQDLFLLIEYIWYHHRDLWKISRETESDFAAEDGRNYHIVSTNRLLGEFPALIGGKTGFTDEAKGTLVLLYPTKTNRVAVIIILNSENRFEDGRRIIKWLEEIF